MTKSRLLRYDWSAQLRLVLCDWPVVLGLLRCDWLLISLTVYILRITMFYEFKLVFHFTVTELFGMCCIL